MPRGGGYPGGMMKLRFDWYMREFKQISTAAVTEKVWGEYVLVVWHTLTKRNTKMSETWAKEFKISFI